MTTFRDLKRGDRFGFTDSKQGWPQGLVVVEGFGVKGFITSDFRLHRVVDWNVEVIKS